MERCLFALLLFTGVDLLVSLEPYRYYLFQQGKNWNDARAYCQAKYFDLAIIRNSEDLVQLQKRVQAQRFSSNAWIGLYTETNPWLWSMGKEHLGSMTSWFLNQPDNWMGKELCGLIFGSQWNDSPCTDLLTFICFDATQTGIQSYITVSLFKTWYGAQAYCRTFYTDLASSRDAAENTILAGLQNTPSWFGLYSESWIWPDRSKFSTPSWIPGQPDNAGGKENCGYINNGQIGDAMCPNIMPFVCYGVPTKKLMRMKVKVQSKQDVNDFQLNAAILGQIKTKLTALGIADYITSKWLQQPDGTVFLQERK